ncbi:MAG: hypothetical protein PHG83_01215 [Patescibacteria group bacterium]|nr:hypothetical protein [Patescibacteria group bacterium]
MWYQIKRQGERAYPAAKENTPKCVIIKKARGLVLQGEKSSLITEENLKVKALKYEGNNQWKVDFVDINVGNPIESPGAWEAKKRIALANNLKITDLFAEKIKK